MLTKDMLNGKNDHPPYPEPTGPATEAPTPGRIWNGIDLNPDPMAPSLLGMSGLITVESGQAFMYMIVPDPEGQPKVFIRHRAPHHDVLQEGELQRLVEQPKTLAPEIDKPWRGPEDNWEPPTAINQWLVFGYAGKLFQALTVPDPHQIKQLQEHGQWDLAQEWGHIPRQLLVRAELPADHNQDHMMRKLDVIHIWPADAVKAALEQTAERG